MKYFIITFGCQMNKSDSERIASFLEERAQMEETKKMNNADLLVVNMCSVRQSAVDRVYGLLPKIEKLRKSKKNFKALLTGCILKKDIENFKNHFDYILHIKTLPYWKKFLSKENYFYFPSGLRDKNFHKRFGIKYLRIRPKYSLSFRAFVPIATGCNNFCTFCVVPFTRGPESFRPAKDILEEIRYLSEKNYKEIWLLGQNVDSYKSGKINFAKLLEKIEKIPGDFWLRFTSPHPKDFSEELIEVIAKSKKITPYINLPVQSGDNDILKKMRRPYDIKKYKEIIKKIRKYFKKYRQGLEKDPSISTDIIVGFPGETKKQLKNTLKLIEEIKFDSVYLARYSPRSGTEAAEFKNQLTDLEKKEREKILQKKIEKISLGRNKRFIGEIVPVLIDSKGKNYLLGKSRHFKTVKVPSSHKKNLKPGIILRVKITKATPFGLKGEISQK